MKRFKVVGTYTITHEIERYIIDETAAGARRQIVAAVDLESRRGMPRGLVKESRATKLTLASAIPEGK